VAIRAQRGRVERHEGQLRDRQAPVQLDGDPREIVELERQRALPAGVAEARGGVDDQTEAAQARFPLDSGHDVLRQLDPLHRAAEGELTGVDHERLSALDPDLLRQVARRLAQVDARHAVVVEHAEGVAEAQVHARGLDQRLVPRSILIRPSRTRRMIVPSDRTEVVGALLTPQFWQP